jgi:hypothetical protein
MSTGEKGKFYMYFGVQIPSPAHKNISLETEAINTVLTNVFMRII